SISSREDLIDSSEGGSEVSAHAALSSAAPEARNALVMAQRTNCRPIAIQVRLIVMSASPPRWGMPLLRGSRIGLRIRPASGPNPPARGGRPVRLDSLKTRVYDPDQAPNT